MKYKYDAVLIWPYSLRMRFNISGVFPMMPTGIATLGAWLRKQGKSVHLIDVQGEKLNQEALKNRVFKFSSRIYGISATLFNISSAFEVAEMIKEIHPDSTVVMGGPISVFPPEVLLDECVFVDGIISGEGEIPLQRLVEGAALQSIPGLTYRDDRGRYHDNPESAPLDMDEIPVPWREGLKGRYRIHPPYGIREPAIVVETSRGCTYQCAFCSISHDYRYRSVEGVMQEIEEAVLNQGAKEIYFADPTFTLCRERIEEICRAILKSDLRFVWSCKSRTDLVDKDLLSLMKKAGCYMISYGVESTSGKVLEDMKKDLNPYLSIKTLGLTRKAGIRSLAYMIIGTPGEKWIDVANSIELLDRCRPDFVLFNRIMPVPHRNMEYDEAKRILDLYQGVLNLKKDYTGRGNWLLRANLRFYLRPGSLMRRVFDIRRIGDVSAAFRAMYCTAYDIFLPELF